MPTRSLTLLILPLLLLWGALGAAASPSLRLAADVWPPFTDVEDKPHEAIDLVKVALQRGGVESTVAILLWSDLIKQLEQGKLDGAPAVWRTPEREKFLLFSKPYLENRLVLVARKGDNVSFPSIGQLAGKRLALVKDYGYGDAVKKAPSVTIVYRDNEAECLRAVLSKQADYLLLDELMVRHLFEFYASKAKELIAAGTIPIVRYPLHFALRKDYPGARQILDNFDRNITRMMSDGTYNVLLHVPWIRTDVNGDGVPEFVASTKQQMNTPQGGGDPSKTQGGYPVFYDTGPAPIVGRTPPSYIIDGKTYNTWGDAATNVERAGPTKPQGLYKYSTGVVLFDF